MSIRTKRDGIEVEVYQHEDGRWRIEVTGMPGLQQEFGQNLARVVGAQCGDFLRTHRHLDREVDELEMFVRSANCIARAGIRYIGELVQRSDAELLKMKNFGRKSLKDVRDALANLGLRPGMDNPWWIRPDQRPPTTPPTP